jgi:hypothetical protein
VQGVWNGLGQEISDKCFLTSHNFHNVTTPWWTSKFVWILYKGEGARLDATSSNHLDSVQTKKMPAVFIWSDILRIVHTVLLWHVSSYVLIILWNVSYCWVEQCNYVRSSGFFSFHQSPSHLSYELGVLINLFMLLLINEGCTHKSLFFFSFI